MAGEQQYEVEVKSLLGDATDVATFITKLRQRDPQLALKAESDQLNHYFDDSGDSEALYERVKDLLIEESDRSGMRAILDGFSSYSIRTRLENKKVYFVIKAAREGEDKDHALARIEGSYLSMAPIEELDAAILASGYGYLSKWSRSRKEYSYRGYNVCLDKNAGYGYILEIEKVVTTEADATTTKSEILAELEDLGLEELPQDRLGRMFAHYNKHWSDYYQTDKTFTVA